MEKFEKRPPSQELNILNILKEKSDIELEHDPVLALKLDQEKDIRNEQIPGQAYWLALEGSKINPELDTVEGKLFVPDKEIKNNEVVMFFPGTPGDESPATEKLYATDLVKKGYTVWVARHSGLLLDRAEKTQQFLGCSERQKLAEQNNKKRVLGLNPEKQYTWLDWAREPIPAIVNFTKSFKKIHCVGRSFGVFELAYSLAKMKNDPNYSNLSKSLAEVASFISLAGYIDKPEKGLAIKQALEKERFILGSEQIAEAEIKSYEGIIQFLPDKEQILKDWKEISDYIFSRELPEHIVVRFVLSPEDEFISTESNQRYLKFLNRGLLLRDETQFDPKSPQHYREWRRIYGLSPLPEEMSDEEVLELAKNEKMYRMYHMTGNVRSETLIRLFKSKYTKAGPHTWTVRRKIPKK